MPWKPDAEYEWLEQPLAAECLEWVAQENAATSAALDQLPEVQAASKRLESLAGVDPKLPGYWLAGRLFRLQKDAPHPSGLLQVADKDDVAADRDWRTVIDLDELNRAENKSYIFVEFDLKSRVLGKDASRILLYLSNRGSDLVELIEVDGLQGGIVEGGFRAGPDRLAAAWMDENHVLIQQSLTDGLKLPAGMPRTTFIWARGQPLREAQPVYTAPMTDAISLVTSIGPTDSACGLIVRAVTFTRWIFYAVSLSGRVEELDIPQQQPLMVPPRTTREHVVVSLLEEATIRGSKVPSGSIVACSINPDVPAGQRLSLVYVPREDEFTPHIVTDGLQTGQTTAYLTVSKAGQERRLVMEYEGCEKPTWKVVRETPMAVGSHVSLLSADVYSNDVVMSESGLLLPGTLRMESRDGTLRHLHRQDAVFDADSFVLGHNLARSDDGTLVDYVLLSPKQTRHPPGQSPVLVTAYGGFGISMMMRYMDPMLGSTSLVPWLEAGGSLAIALIRGGGERGPRWHQEGRGVNRPNSYADFAAVARKLVDDGFTTTRRMGVFGISGGGLLAAVMATQHGAQFGATVSDVPLTDMLRYPSMGMGAAWTVEYGDPGDGPAMVEVLRSYSPFHNAGDEAARVCPPLLVTTSTEDDRVGVGHSRKLVARLQDAGAPRVFLHEARDGGHNVSDPFTNAKLMAKRIGFLMHFLAY